MTWGISRTGHPVPPLVWAGVLTVAFAVTIRAQRYITISRPIAPVKESPDPSRRSCLLMPGIRHAISDAETVFRHHLVRFGPG